METKTSIVHSIEPGKRREELGNRGGLLDLNFYVVAQRIQVLRHKPSYKAKILLSIYFRIPNQCSVIHNGNTKFFQQFS
jgi:hypothetical protein